MSSKNVESKRSEVLSITRRLTLLYVVSTAVLLSLAVGFLDWTLNRSLEISRRGLIANKVEVIRHLLREQPEKREALVSEVEHEASASHALKYLVRIINEKGEVQFETQGMKELLTTSLFPAPSNRDAEFQNIVKWETPPNRSFLLLSIRTPVGSAGREEWTVQMGLDVSTRVALMTEYRRRLLAVLGLGIIFAAVAGVWVARQGMRPLLEITKATERITASHLHERIAVSQWPAELVELASHFNAMLDRLEDSFRRLSEFSADVAHALRSPINNLRGEAEVALSRARSNEEYQHALASNLEECERLARMIDALLFLARADDPKTAVERLQFDAGKEVEAVREFYEALAAEQEVSVRCEGAARLTGDPMLFRRAVSNLLANALRHTPAGGDVLISLHSNQSSVELRVQDTGCGIAPEHLPRVYDRFYRVGESQSQVPGGSGLGLAIVQSIVRLHGGSVGIQSALGKGTMVTLKFPSATNAAVA